MLVGTMVRCWLLSSRFPSDFFAIFYCQWLFSAFFSKYRCHLAKKRGLEQGTVEQQLDATKKELRKVKKRNKALEGEKKALEDKLSFVKKSLE